MEKVCHRYDVAVVPEFRLREVGVVSPRKGGGEKKKTPGKKNSRGQTLGLLLSSHVSSGLLRILLVTIT